MDVRGAVKDHFGYVHSIDMVTLDYLLVGSYKTVTDHLIALLEKHGMLKEKNTKLDILPNFKYEYYTNYVWYDGFTFFLGKWSNYDRSDKTWYNIDMMRLKVNPNKHMGSALMDDVLFFLGEWCRDGVLIRYDYAVDVPVPLSDVLVINSRKLKGLYKGTRYFGRRHNHGYLKIYDKAAEQKMDGDLTRIEYTMVPDQIPSWDNIVIRAPVLSTDASVIELPSQSKLYLDMLIELRELGADVDQYIERMNYRTWKRIEPYYQSGVRLEFDSEINNCLLENVCSVFIVTRNQQLVKDNFMECFDTELPFD